MQELPVHEAIKYYVNVQHSTLAQMCSCQLKHFWVNYQLPQG